MDISINPVLCDYSRTMSVPVYVCWRAGHVCHCLAVQAACEGAASSRGEGPSLAPTATRITTMGMGKIVTKSFSHKNQISNSLKTFNNSFPQSTDKLPNFNKLPTARRYILKTQVVLMPINAGNKEI